MKRRDFIRRSLGGAAVSALGTSCTGKIHCGDDGKLPVDAATTNYTRMFPQLAKPPSVPNSDLEQGLEKLGRLMTDDDDAESGNGIVPAGYTYLGQFIDHDLTFDVTSLAFAHPCAESIVNHRSPFLDLDHLYGGGPTVSKFLYHNNPSDRDKERFLIGPDAKNGLEYDLPRNHEGIALVGDPRNDENLIIAQLHVAFLKFHNRLLHELEKGSGSSIQTAGPAGATFFEQARRLVTWHYQYIVLNDFLRKLLDLKVYQSLELERMLPAPNDFRSFRIPIEFSAAAFRFGHSMVRNKYPYNTPQGEVSLSDLLAHTGVGGDAVPALPPDWIINWCKFFPIDTVPRRSRAIDTGIANALHSLDPRTVRLFNASTSSEPSRRTPSDKTPPYQVLPVTTLWRGARMGLPSGQDVARAMGLKPLGNDDVAPDNALHTETLRCFGFDKDTPLWYYILKEAELLGGGQRLGPVGSRIVANVIVGALRADPNSYLSVDPAWKPPASTEGIGEILYFVDPRCG
jgi:Animal haem peroxidase